MLSQLNRLSSAADGRYATDAELEFMADYARSFNLRLQTYQKLRELESELVKQTYIKVRSLDANLFSPTKLDEPTSVRCHRDITMVLRYAAATMLADDPDALQEKLLLWLQTITRAFGKQRSCQVIYQVLQTVVKQNLPPAQANLVCPILEMCSSTLGPVT